MEYNNQILIFTAYPVCNFRPIQRNNMTSLENSKRNNTASFLKFSAIRLPFHTFSWWFPRGRIDDARDDARKMIAAGCDVNHRDTDGTTPLHHAAKAGRQIAVQVLLEYGVDALFRMQRVKPHCITHSILFHHYSECILMSYHSMRRLVT